jgi:hypothetical protein
VNELNVFTRFECNDLLANPFGVQRFIDDVSDSSNIKYLDLPPWPRAFSFMRLDHLPIIGANQLLFTQISRTCDLTFDAVREICWNSMAYGVRARRFNSLLP